MPRSNESAGLDSASPFVSFAQNFEDVLLWRALGHVSRGRYIDIGAADPRVDSVTLAFYERGWRGVNVEPNPAVFELLERARPEDVNLNVALGDEISHATLYVVDEPGLSTLDPIEAELRASEGHRVTGRPVAVDTLASIAARFLTAGEDIHFLKVDVEGGERAVLVGNDWSVARPWIVLVEATRPKTQTPAFEEWEDILEGADYGLVYEDGLNRFYVAAEHDELLDAFAFPPNVFDRFVRDIERRAIDRAERAELELARIYASREWRLTSPVRAAFSAIRRIRDRARGVGNVRSDPS